MKPKKSGPKKWMNPESICALHDTAVYHYRKAPIDNDITLEKWGLFLGFASNNEVSKPIPP